jgi:hypothetical protein
MAGFSFAERLALLSYEEVAQHFLQLMKDVITWLNQHAVATEET